MSDQRIPKEKKDSLLTQAREIAADILEYKVINRIHYGKDVQKVLALIPDDNDQEMRFFRSITPPKAMTDHMNLIDSALAQSPITEASIRSNIDAFILFVNKITAAQTPPTWPLSIQTERSYSFGPVRLRGKKAKLSTSIDYRVWYGDDEQLPVNLIVIGMEERLDEIAQCLGYMGCVHRERKQVSKQDATVYGLATDSQVFHFLKISHDFKWSEWIVSS
ncbi:uncharacterized protein N7506_001625 [Penicillium brevicompactum]|uniref:uncharacterized protein n=1 Tax=Penicillium brevicompactum TaxID=5074 RepID=UPI002540A73C|nr:uncharacterized protein N7506_001625 [Penicillium brevicompactum]KAJ5348372.1 hypothetical protein N7506_001625 [Penicillium brevicompactum]